MSILSSSFLFLFLAISLCSSTENVTSSNRKPSHKPKPTQKPHPTHIPPSPYASVSWQDDLSTLCLKVISDCRLVNGQYRDCLASAGCPISNGYHGNDCKVAMSACEGELMRCVLEKNPTYDCSFYMQ